MVPAIKGQIARLKTPAGDRRRRGDAPTEEASDVAAGGQSDAAVAKRLDRLEHLIQEMNEHLKTIETRLPPPKQ
jgi:hypothetical protein